MTSSIFLSSGLSSAAQIWFPQVEHNMFELQLLSSDLRNIEDVIYDFQQRIRPNP